MDFFFKVSEESKALSDLFFFCEVLFYNWKPIQFSLYGALRLSDLWKLMSVLSVIWQVWVIAFAGVTERPLGINACKLGSFASLYTAGAVAVDLDLQCFL